MPRKLSVLIVLLLFSALAGGFARPAAAAPIRQASGQTFTVLVGGQSAPEQKEPDMMPAGAWQYMRFYPDKLTINVGDTVVWKINSAEIHQVVFPPPGQSYLPYNIVEAGGNGPPTVALNPQVISPQGGSTYDGSALAGSGDLGMGPAPFVQEYRLTFTKAGSFNYLCPIHSAQLPSGQVVGMLGNVTVQDAGSAYPKTPAQVDTDAQAAQAADTQAAQAAEPQAKQVPPPSPGANGTMIYHGNMGYDAGPMSYMRFAPENFTIHVGDTIEWTQTSAETPHTVTLTSGAPEPAIPLVQPQAGGPPKIVMNPAVLLPAGGAAYDGSGYFNSGFILGAQSGAPGPQSYRLTFTTPGTYEYTCILHDEMGMNGHVTVLAAGQPGMPTTGQADYAWLAWMLVGAVLFCNGLILYRRRTA